MLSNNKKLIAVIGATGHQGGAVVRALQAGGQFKVRALTRNPDQHRDLADEVVEADLNRPETLAAAFKRAYGVFLVTTSSLEGTDERKQGAAAVQAAKDAGVKHVVWSTLPDVEAISGGKFNVPHFTSKAKVDPIVKDAGFANHTFVIAPFFYQNLAGAMAPQQQADGSMAGRSRSIRVCVAFRWVTFANSAPSSLEPSRTRIRPAMASICPSSVIS
jgi:uncharacterized protein YbjT (DUF2867 family)